MIVVVPVVLRKAWRRSVLVWRCAQLLELFLRRRPGPHGLLHAQRDGLDQEDQERGRALATALLGKAGGG